MLNELRGGRRKTARELAEVLEIQVSAARKHLEVLSELSIVKEEFIQDGIGRPKKFYLLTDEGFELFPRQYETVLCALLDRIEASNGSAGESIVKTIAREIANGIKTGGSDEPNVSLERRVNPEDLVKFLDAFGFDCALEEDGPHLAITSRNCPLFKAAVKHQKIVCHGLHDEIIKTALGTREVKLEACMSRGDGECRHIITSKRV